ncbi:hypothetical protein SY2F82_45930 [Streptomyces sp. Y2F8-2]|nr:hypothetical protein SY2F82_45930 [Streptomyces sp. Y2F8-2]
MNAPVRPPEGPVAGHDRGALTPGTTEGPAPRARPRGRTPDTTEGLVPRTGYEPLDTSNSSVVGALYQAVTRTMSACGPF